jgi:hypothetical protein
MGIVANLAAIAVLGALIWLVLRPRYLFVIRIEGGVPRVARGQGTRAFLGQVAQACAEAGVAHGWVGAAPQGRRVRLVFSRTIPASCQQRLRNSWSLLG